MAVLGSTSPKLGGVGTVVRPVGVDSPFVRGSWGAYCIILIESKEVLVLENFDVFPAQRANVGSDDQRRLHGRPQSKVRARLGRCQVPITNLQHIGVVVAPKVDRVQLERVHVDDVHEGAPVWLDVIAHAPAYGRAITPGEHISRPPDAQVVNDLARLLLQSIAHSVEPLSRLGLGPGYTPEGRDEV